MLEKPPVTVVEVALTDRNPTTCTQLLMYCSGFDFLTIQEAIVHSCTGIFPNSDDGRGKNWQKRKSLN